MILFNLKKLNSIVILYICESSIHYIVLTTNIIKTNVSSRAMVSIVIRLPVGLGANLTLTVESE